MGVIKGDTIVQISEDESKEKMMAGLDFRGSIEAYRVLQGLMWIMEREMETTIMGSASKP